MGYVLEFWSLDRDELAELLHQAPFAELAAGGGELTVEQARELTDLVRRLGSPAGSVDHGSGARTWFLDQFDDAGAVAATLGEPVAGHLMGRPIEGLTTEVFPTLGWLTNAELTAALADARPAPDAEAQGAELVAGIVGALRVTAMRERDLVTIYT